MINKRVQIKTAYNNRLVLVTWRALRNVLSEGLRPTLVDEEWDCFIHMAAMNQMSGWAYKIGKEFDLFPGDVLKLLKDDYFTCAGLNLISDKVLKGTVEVLDRAGIVCVPLKGAVFRHLLYSDPGCRISVDIDLLVRKEDQEKSHLQLIDAGYTRVGVPVGREETAKGFYERSYRHPEISTAGTLIDIHSGFSQFERFSGPYRDVWRRCLKLDDMLSRTDRKSPDGLFPYGNNCLFLSPEDALVHLFVHTAKHSFDVPLQSFLDVKLILERWRPDLELVVERARQWHATTAAYFTLLVSQIVLGARFSEDILEKLKPPWFKRSWLGLFISQEGELDPESGCDQMVRFFRFARHVRLQQALVGMPIIDGFWHTVRFCWVYAALRVRDWFEYQPEK
jgi:putative nucleotidyltransferase-like protein